MCLLAALALMACSDSNSPPGAFSVTPDTASVTAGKFLQLHADNATGPVAWSTSDTTVAAVTRGLVVATGVGTATITASQGGRSNTASITVTPLTTQPTLHDDVQPIFDLVCASCHSGPNPEESVDLSSEAASRASLVNQPCHSVGSCTLVVPGDYLHSYLTYQLIAQATNPADNMPDGCSHQTPNACLAPTTIYLILVWIAGGAP